MTTGYQIKEKEAWYYAIRNMVRFIELRADRVMKDCFAALAMAWGLNHCKS